MNCKPVTCCLEKCLTGRVGSGFGKLDLRMQVRDVESPV